MDFHYYLIGWGCLFDQNNWL